jgi:glycosyltransferase involved in cell wall biosynthesis
MSSGREVFMPKFSILIPVFNRETLLARAVNSVLEQSFEDWELIIIDDCSTDNTLMVADSFSDKRIKILRMPINSGPAAARNMGIKQARGKLISLLDSDDVFHPEFLAHTYKAIKNSSFQYGFSYTSVGDVRETDLQAVKKNGSLWRISDRFLVFKRPFLYQLQIGTAAGITFKKEVFDKIGYFDEQLKAAEDTDFFIRLSEFFKGLPIYEILIFKDYVTADRLTSDYTKLAKAYHVILSKNLDVIITDVQLVRRWYYKSMWLDLYSGDKAGARKNFLQLIKRKALTAKSTFVFLTGVIMPKKYFILFHKKLNSLFK